MNADQSESKENEPASRPRRSSEEVVRQLEQFPAEVLEAALRVLQMRQISPEE